MPSKSTLLAFAFAFALLVAATPTTSPQEKRTGEGISIRFPGRSSSSFKRENGVFDFDAAIKSRQRTIMKHTRNQENLSRYVRSKSLQNAPVNATDLRRRQKNLVSDVPLTDDGEVVWSGTVSIGTPGQNFMVQIDTASSDLWVASKFCTLAACSHKHQYDPDVSKTSSLQDGQFKINYVGGTTVSGPLFLDTVSVGGIEVSSQIFSPVDHITDDFSGGLVDGILGLAYPSVANIPGPNEPFFNTAWLQGAIESKMFALKLGDAGSVLTIGGVDITLFTGNIETYPVLNTSTDFSVWQIGGATINVNSSPLVTGFITVFDSGTTGIYGPVDLIAHFYTGVPGSKPIDSMSGFYSFPCSSPPSVSFDWGGQQWSIPPEDFSIGPTAEGSSDCIGLINGADTVYGPITWVVGDALMKYMYTIFSMADNTIGLAKLA